MIQDDWPAWNWNWKMRLCVKSCWYEIEHKLPSKTVSLLGPFIFIIVNSFGKTTFCVSDKKSTIHWICHRIKFQLYKAIVTLDIKCVKNATSNIGQNSHQSDVINSAGFPYVRSHPSSLHSRTRALFFTHFTHFYSIKNADKFSCRPFRSRFFVVSGYEYMQIWLIN